MNADIVEQGTCAREGFTGTGSSGSHGAKGEVFANPAVDLDGLVDLGLQGSNISRLDGSGSFEAPSTFARFRATRGGLPGFWFDAESYDNP